VALELYRPLIFPLRRADLVTQNVAAVAIAFGFAIAGFLNVTATQRRTYLALLTPSIIVIIVVSLGRRLTGIDDVVNSVGKYNTYAYLWFSLANFYLLSCLVAKIPVRWR
jgi:surface polysaccharide O-acyltransferase-like enzyme